MRTSEARSLQDRCAVPGSLVLIADIKHHLPHIADDDIGTVDHDVMAALAGDDAAAVRRELLEVLLQSGPDGIGCDALRVPARLGTIGILRDDKQRKIAAAGRLSGLFAGTPKVVTEESYT